jgi:hypothetical protein
MRSCYVADVARQFRGARYILKIRSAVLAGRRVATMLAEHGKRPDSGK